MLSTDSFWLKLKKHFPALELTDNPRFLLAYSGGKDSHVLLHLFATLYRSELIQNIRAIHINHQLQLDSDKWAVHCEQQCREYNISCDVIPVDVDTSSGVSLEASARTARYSIFEKSISSKEILITAQHADDQVETFFLQALRGGGVKGLAAMPSFKKIGDGFLYRPLLDVNQAEIDEYAVKHNLNWIEDPSNKDTRFDRNFLRNQILPEIKKRWPGINYTINRVTQYQAESAELQQDLAEIDLNELKPKDNYLSISSLKRLSLSRQKNVLRYWLHVVLKHEMPDANHLMRIINEVMDCAFDAQPCVEWSDSIVRRHQDSLYVDFALEDAANLPVLDFDCEKQALIKLGKQTLKTERVIGQGLSLEKLKNQNISIRFRQGGETCRPKGRAQHSHTLKKLLQEWGVPPWKRDSIPLIYIGNELAQVVGFCICEPFVANPDEKACLISFVNGNK